MRGYRFRVMETIPVRGTTYWCCLLAMACSLASAQSTGQPNIPSGSLPAIYQSWLDEDVRWIITPEEQAQFTLLSTNADRDAFVEEFWQRRDPTPDTTENQYKEEHYRRIAYSNVHFAARDKGSLTDRGRTNIFYGPPDGITEESVTDGVAAPTEIWHYEDFEPYDGTRREWEGKQPRTLNRVDVVFVDDCKCGEYRLQTPDPQ